ncbi:MAG TPA: hypothetical protein VMT87_12835 [Vicinamibacteria bacterium]|nr:hypothetical protein [Vicinamibacteria bacterium]
MSPVPRRAPRAAIVAGAIVPLLLAARSAAPEPEPPFAAPSCPAPLGRPVALPLRALELAFLGPDRLLALDGAEVALFELGEGGARLLSRASLPGPLEVVRAPGGLLQASERDAAAWAMTSRSPRAVLLAVESGALVEREQAEALPFPGAPRGLRFRAGTNLIEGEVEGLGGGPFLDVTGTGTPLAVSPEGRLLAAGAGGAAARVGPTLAPLWPGLVAASAASPPGHDDALLVLTATGTQPLLSCPAPGPVRAIAARVHGETARLAVAVDDGEGGSSLLMFELVHPQPGAQTPPRP